jgi:hypothetical protein
MSDMQLLYLLCRSSECNDVLSLFVFPSHLLLHRNAVLNHNVDHRCIGTYPEHCAPARNLIGPQLHPYSGEAPLFSFSMISRGETVLLTVPVLTKLGRILYKHPFTQFLDGLQVQALTTQKRSGERADRNIIPTLIFSRVSIVERRALLSMTGLRCSQNFYNS